VNNPRRYRGVFTCHNWQVNPPPRRPRYRGLLILLAATVAASVPLFLAARYALGA